MQTFRINQTRPDPLVVNEIAELLKADGVIAFPTDTFYGLGADIYSDIAVKRIFEIKGRLNVKPILILISDKEELSTLISSENVSEISNRLIKEFWPGPLTLVFKASDMVSKYLTGGTEKIGVRLPDHTFCRLLIQKLGSPVTATSANISGKGSINDPFDVAKAIGRKIDALVDGGKTMGRVESTVVDVSGREPVVIREGAIASVLISRSKKLEAR